MRKLALGVIVEVQVVIRTIWKKTVVLKKVMRRKTLSSLEEERSVVCARGNYLTVIHEF
jgi:hypothetical protein